MKKPNFFIAGAPRCGTTAFYTYLAAHPNIFMSEVKELNYFADDFQGNQKISFQSLDDYLKLFSGAGSEHIMVGEASPFYLFSKVAFSNMYRYDSKAKIILTLRNPVDFVQSFHRLNLSLLREDEGDLRKAWELEDERSEGRNVPKSCREPALILYRELGLFGKHVERLLSIFPRHQVKVIIFEDFTSDPQAAYESVLSFLGVPSDGRTEFPMINVRFENRFALLARVFHPPQSIYKMFMKVVSIFGVGFMKNVSKVYNIIERLNTTTVSRTPLAPGFRKELLDYFRNDILKLSNLIDLDLDHWLA